MPNVRVHCPSCKKVGSFEISDEAMKNTLRGLLAVNLASGVICEHSFIAYVDKNSNIRDYFIADFKIETPEMVPEQKIIDKMLEKDVVDVDLIKLNISATLLTYILKSLFSKQKIVLISSQEFLYHHILNFFKYITKDSFETDISIITEEHYNNNKKNYKDSMVFERNNIIRNVNKIINPKKLFVEKQIVKNFLFEGELGYSYIVLKNEIQKAYQLSKEIVDLIKDSRQKNESVNILKINTDLEKKYNIKINMLYLRFLIDIVKNYFGESVPSFTDSFFEFL